MKRRGEKTKNETKQKNAKQHKKQNKRDRKELIIILYPLYIKHSFTSHLKTLIRYNCNGFKRCTPGKKRKEKYQYERIKKKINLIFLLRQRETNSETQRIKSFLFLKNGFILYLLVFILIQQENIFSFCFIFNSLDNSCFELEIAMQDIWLRGISQDFIEETLLRGEERWN